MDDFEIAALYAAFRAETQRRMYWLDGDGGAWLVQGMRLNYIAPDAPDDPPEPVAMIRKPGVVLPYVALRSTEAHCFVTFNHFLTEPLCPKKTSKPSRPPCKRVSSARPCITLSAAGQRFSRLYGTAPSLSKCAGTIAITAKATR
jgi:hypothetical protein